MRSQLLQLELNEQEQSILDLPGKAVECILPAMLQHRRGQPLITQHSIEDSLQSLHHSERMFAANILLVEDILPNQVIAQKILTKLGLSVDVANNGKEAVSLFQQQDYDLVFMDCRMPVMDGYQATEVMRDYEIEKPDRRRVPIIALTANSSREERELCLGAGMDDVVTKPFKQADLANCLQRWQRPRTSRWKFPRSDK